MLRKLTVRLEIVRALAGTSLVQLTLLNVSFDPSRPLPLSTRSSIARGRARSLRRICTFSTRLKAINHGIIDQDGTDERRRERRHQARRHAEDILERPATDFLKDFFRSIE
jgi:hypothetical protein